MGGEMEVAQNWRSFHMSYTDDKAKRQKWSSLTGYTFSCRLGLLLVERCKERTSSTMKIPKVREREACGRNQQHRR